MLYFSTEEDFVIQGAVQQFKIGRKIKANRASNPKRSEFFSAKSNYGTASQGPEPPDGNPIISDGDLLGPGCVVFARNKIIKFLDHASQVSRDEWLQNLPGLLKEYNIDIAILLPSSVPAGIPDRGVDFGLDAVIADRDGNRETIQFSTEILYEGEPCFTDGDILQIGNGVVCTNEDLIHRLTINSTSRK